MAMRTLATGLAMALVLAACGKKETPAPPPAQNSPGAKASVESLVSGQNAPPPPPTVAAPEAPAAPGAPAPVVAEGNWWSRKAVGEKREIMEGWLHQYQSGNPAAKAAILDQIKNSKISAEDKAMLEEMRVRFKYPPLPVK